MGPRRGAWKNMRESVREGSQVVASMGPRRGAWKNIALKLLTPRINQGFNGATPGGVEKPKPGPSSRAAAQSFNGATPGGVEKLACAGCWRGGSTGFNGATPGGVEKHRTR